MSKRSSNADSHFEALFGARTGESLTNSLKLVPAGHIQRAAQARKSFPQQELDELAHSIEDLRSRAEGVEGTGILQPLLVAENPYGHEFPYRLIAGERRYRAAGIVGLDTLPCLVVEMDEDSIAVAQLVENLQRQNLAPLEEARAIEALMASQKLSIRDSARLLGKGKGYIENRLALLKMGADVQAMVETRADSLLHAREIDSITDAALRAELIDAVLHESLSRAMLRDRIGAGAPEPGGNRTGLSVRTDSRGHAQKEPGASRNVKTSTLRPIVQSLSETVDEFETRLGELKAPESQLARLSQDVQALRQQVAQLQDLIAGTEA
jgi:ParB/RepB/Spo0J family partition protein